MHSLVPRPIRTENGTGLEQGYGMHVLYHSTCHQADVPQVIMNNFPHVLCSIYYISSALDTIQQTDNFWSKSKCVRVQI